MTTSGNQSGTKMKIRAEGGKFDIVLLGVHIKFPIGKTYEYHIFDEEYTAVQKCKIRAEGGGSAY